MATAIRLPAPAPVPADTGVAPARVFGWRRVVVVFGAATVLGWLIGLTFEDTPRIAVIARYWFVAFVALLAFSLFERWPRRLPRWLARWPLQVAAVAASIPMSVLVMYIVISAGDALPWWRNNLRLTGMAMFMVTGLLFAPWIAVAAIFRQRDDAARAQALAFELARSQLERDALDARLRLLQAQVEPHFLFNTLANVRELVDARSPQASAVLTSLIAYLRAAVPRLAEPATTLGQELDLVRAYLELMHMRMPDRLQFTLQADDAARALRCPPTTLLTLVENAVRHGIDPSEVGGRIDVNVQVRDGRCHVQVSDTGVGLANASAGLGTGLAALRERLALVFGAAATLDLYAIAPHGVHAEIAFPAQVVAP